MGGGRSCAVECLNCGAELVPGALRGDDAGNERVACPECGSWMWAEGAEDGKTFGVEPGSAGGGPHPAGHPPGGTGVATPSPGDREGEKHENPPPAGKALDWSSIPRVPGGYRTVLVDPPWKYAQKLVQKARGGAAKWYRTLTVAEIGTLPIRELAGRDCQLWLWTTNTFLHDAFHLLEDWGFTYKSKITWAKGHVTSGRLTLQMGLGYWLHGVTEELLLATVGDPRWKMRGPKGATGLNLSTLLLEPDVDADEAGASALLLEAKGPHSVKPENSYRVVEAMGMEPRLELFARRPRPGWAVWGDQIPAGLEAFDRAVVP